jgi:hypothetical protein
MRLFQNVSRLQRDSRSRKAIRQGGLTTPLKYSGTGIHTWSISRIALKVSADASLRVTKVPKFEPVEAKRRSCSSGTQILGKRGRFEIGSGEKDENGNWLVDAASLQLPFMKKLIR